MKPDNWDSVLLLREKGGEMDFEDVAIVVFDVGRVLWNIVDTFLAFLPIVLTLPMVFGFLHPIHGDAIMADATWRRGLVVLECEWRQGGELQQLVEVVDFGLIYIELERFDLERCALRDLLVRHVGGRGVRL